MTDFDLLAQRFETHRSRLRAVALRMLGSGHEAEDAVQEAWLRLARSDAEAVDNLRGWLTTVVARVCLDVLRSRAREQEVTSGTAPEPAAVGSPEEEALLVDSVGHALLVVLDTLEPAERLAFVLHDMFAVPYEEIAPIVGRSPVAARAARLTLVDGLVGAVVSVGGRPMAVFSFTVGDGRVVGIELLADPRTLAVLDLEPARG